jgi:hypothetical protein
MRLFRCNARNRSVDYGSVCLITPSHSIAIDKFIVDQDSFLPSAIQRYHQLLMPALQVVSGMLASLGPKHTTVANQVPKIALLVPC